MEAASDADERSRLLADLATVNAEMRAMEEHGFSVAGQNAFGRVYGRFAGRLFAYCERKVAGRNALPPNTHLEDFFLTALERLFSGLRPALFDRCSTIAEIEKRVCYYFKKPVDWCRTEAWRDYNLQRLPEEFERELKRREQNKTGETVTQDSDLLVRLREALSELDEKDRDIIQTARQYINVDADCRVEWPAEESERLRMKYGFASRNALNVYRERLFKKLGTFIA